MKMIPMPEAGDKFWRHGHIVGTIVEGEGDWPEYIEEGNGRDEFEHEARWAVSVDFPFRQGHEKNVHVRWMGPEADAWGEV